MRKGRILVIDRDNSLQDALSGALRGQEHEVQAVASGGEGLELFQTKSPDLVITALRLPDMAGIKVLEQVRRINRLTPVIIVTAHADMESVIDAMRLGAYDFFTKPLDMVRLKIQIARALQSGNPPADLVLPAEYYIDGNGNSPVMVGKSPGMLDVFKKIGQISSNRVSVLIQGESGTGKELVSRVIHNSGITKGLPFVAVDLSTLPETLVESELFGHVKGAFTGAVKDRKGRFETAADGTVFLDEISEIPMGLQVKLLRILQEREFEPVGDGVTLPMKARVIAATNRNLEELVRQGKFREDLFYRISVFRIDLPALRERKDDLPVLVTYLLQKINRELNKNVRKVPHEVMEVFRNHEWVGNVRELENVLMQAVVLANGDTLNPEDIFFRQNLNRPAAPERQDLSLDCVEKEHIEYVLNKTSWDKTEAAKLLKISRHTLYNKIKAYNITPH